MNSENTQDSQHTDGIAGVTRRRALGLMAAGGALVVPISGGMPRAAAQGRPGAGGLAVTGGGDLPAWFEHNRVPAHLHMGAVSWWDNPNQPDRGEQYAHGGAAMKELGARAYVRFVKQKDCDPWWPSAVPTGPGGERLFDDDRINHYTVRGDIREKFVPAGTHLPKMMAEEADEVGVSVIGYYSYEYDLRFVTSHPEWVCRTPDGEFNDVAYRGALGTVIDIASPFREIVGQRLLELAEAGMEGVYFDRMLLAPWGTFSDWSVQEYRRRTGKPAPTQHAPSGEAYIAWFEADSYHPDYLDWIRFKCDLITETLAYWRDVVHAQYPDFVFVGSVTHLAALTRPDCSTDWAHQLDSVKSEWSLATKNFLRNFVFEHNPDLAVPQDHLAMGLGWATLRDSADGRPAFVWSGVSLPNTAHALGWAGSALAYGCAADVEVYDFYQTADPTNPARPSTPIPAMKAAFALGQQLAPHLADTRPVRFAALHFSESARDQRLTREAGTRAAWQEVLWPINGAFAALHRLGVPTSIVNDRQLTAGDLDGFRILVVTARAELSAEHAAAVAQFEAGGGTVLESAGPWSDPTRTADLTDNFAQQLAPLCRDSPVRVSGGPDRRHCGAYAVPGATGRLVIMVSNDFSWVQNPTIGEDPVINPPAPPATGVRVEWAAPAGFPGAAGRGVLEAVSGLRLPVTVRGGVASVELPPFDHLATLVIDGPLAERQ